MLRRLSGISCKTYLIIQHTLVQSVKLYYTIFAGNLTSWSCPVHVCVCVCEPVYISLSLSLSLSLSQCVSHCVYVRVRACVCSLFVCVCVCVTQRCYARFNYRDKHPQCETTQSFIARPFFSVGATAMRDRYGRAAVTWSPAWFVDNWTGWT